MLIEFRVENHRSIHDEQVFSMEAGRVGNDDALTPRQVHGNSGKLLPVAAIYGANASGKSNVLSAMASMKEAVIYSQRAWSPNDGVSRDPFAWGTKREEPSTFEVECIVNGVRFQYGFRCNDQIFLEEWLFAWPHGKKQNWLARDEEKYRFGENLRGENKVIQGVTRPNALFLSAAAQLRHPQLTPLYSWFGEMEALNLPSRRLFVSQSRFESAVATLLDDSREYRQPNMVADDDAQVLILERFRALLKNADIGILDMRVAKKEGEQEPRHRPARVELKHQSESDDAWLPLEEESKGTRTLFRLALPVLRAIHRGSVLLIDELESSMHPNLAEHIVRQFNDPEVNTRNAQLIFTTHDTNLLGTLVGEPALRRDQVWLTEKDTKGATVLYPLTDFKPRKGENIERGYVQGRYGAIPFLGSFRLPVE